MHIIYLGGIYGWLDYAKFDNTCATSAQSILFMSIAIIYIYTVNSDLSNTGLSGNLSYPTLFCESPSSSCVQFHLIYPTPGLSDTFIGNRWRRINQIPLHNLDFLVKSSNYP